MNSNEEVKSLPARGTAAVSVPLLGSCGDLGCRGFRSLEHVALGNRAGLALSPAQARWPSGNPLFSFKFRVSTIKLAV
jgi:hypothetical protein